MPRAIIGHKKRESTGFSADPDVVAEARAKAPGRNLSYVIENLLKQYNAGTVALTPEPTPQAATA